MKLNLEQIKKLIPHRDPFLFLDNCEIIVPGEHGKAEKLFTNVSSLLDKLAKNNVIHKNKSANLKSKLASHVNSLKATKSKAKSKA